MATQVVFLQKTILTWGKESSSSNLSYSQQSKWTYGGTYLLGDGMVTPTGTD